MALSALAAAAGLGTAGAAEVPPARPGDVAIMEELVAARASARSEAYELFIKRHPDHPLARIARSELRALLERKERPRR
jgi:hypothetical protein